MSLARPPSKVELERRIADGYLSGVIDAHVHTAPDATRDRLLDDFEAVREAERAGLAGVVLKNHETWTADRAAIAQRWAAGSRIEVRGGIALNSSVGGVRPESVEMALDVGATIIWLPTHDALHHRKYFGETGGLTVTTEPEGSEVTEEVKQILTLAREREAVVATGHVSPSEIHALLLFARGVGVPVLITHPEYKVTRLSIGDQRAFVELGAMVERVVVTTTPTIGNLGCTTAELGREIAEVGSASTIISSDLGQAESESPTIGLARFLTELDALGMSRDTLRLITRDNPQRLFKIP